MRFATLLVIALLVLIAVAAAATDADQDGVSDQYDICPGTPAGSTIVDPSQHMDYAGCTCAQVKALVPQNNCTIIYCHETALTINNEVKPPVFVDCPADTCDGVTLTDYPDDGYNKCQDGAWTMHSCAPTTVDCSLRCGCPENYTTPTPAAPEVIVANVTEQETTPENETITFLPRAPTIDAATLQKPGQPLIIFFIPLILLFLVGLLLFVGYGDKR